MGLKLRSEIAANLVNVGYDPAAVAVAVGLPAMANTGPVPAPVARNSSADELELRDARQESPSMVVNVPDPVVNVAAPNVTIEPAMVMLESPVITVEAPAITVEAPTVQVTNTIERKRVKKTIIRDKDNRIESVIEEFMDGDQ